MAAWALLAGTAAGLPLGLSMPSASLPCLPLSSGLLLVLPRNAAFFAVMAVAPRSLAAVLAFLIGVLLGATVGALAVKGGHMASLGFALPEAAAYLLAARRTPPSLAAGASALAAAGLYEALLMAC